VHACSWRLHRDVAESVDALLSDINRQGAAAQGVGALQAAAAAAGAHGGGARGGLGGTGGRAGPAAAAAAAYVPGPVTEVRWYEPGGAGRMMVAFEGAEAERRALVGVEAGWCTAAAGRAWLVELLTRP
jgi:hypothetical protein